MTFPVVPIPLIATPTLFPEMTLRSTSSRTPSEFVPIWLLLGPTPPLAKSNATPVPLDSVFVPAALRPIQFPAKTLFDVLAL